MREWYAWDEEYPEEGSVVVEANNAIDARSEAATALCMEHEAERIVICEKS